MSDWDSEGYYSKHRHKKHKRRESSFDLMRECKKKHKSHKGRSIDKHYDHDRRKLKEESRDCTRIKSESQNRREKKCVKRTEIKEKDDQLQSSGRSFRDSCPSKVKIKENSEDLQDVEAHNREVPEELHEAAVPNTTLPDDLNKDVEELYLLGVDKDRLFDYICNMTKRKFDKKHLLKIYNDVSEVQQRDISEDRALVLIKRVYGVETEEEAKDIFQQLASMDKHKKKVRKSEPGESFAGESKKPPKIKKEERSRHGTSHEWGEKKNKGKPVKAGVEVEKPNFGLSGKLAEETNIFNGVVVKYSEPPEARMPKKRWRLYPFKGDQGLPTLYIHRQSAYLLGRDRKVADIPIDHPSCSKQHAALQYRLVTYQRTDGSVGKQIRLYLIDLESANGTYINNNKIEPRKYVELFEKDVIKFGFSSREYVLLHEHSKDNDESENET